MATRDTAPVQRDDAETGAPGNIDREKDVAIAMVGEHTNEIDPAVAARAVRKTDWFLMPAMTIGCALHPLTLNLFFFLQVP